MKYDLQNSPNRSNKPPSTHPALLHSEKQRRVKAKTHSRSARQNQIFPHKTVPKREIKKTTYRTANIIDTSNDPQRFSIRVMEFRRELILGSDLSHNQSHLLFSCND